MKLTKLAQATELRSLSSVLVTYDKLRELALRDGDELLVLGYPYLQSPCSWE